MAEPMVARQTAPQDSVQEPVLAPPLPVVMMAPAALRAQPHLRKRWPQ
jgi:hypothetical protein